MIENKGSNPADLDQEAKNLYQTGKYQPAAEKFSEAAVLYEDVGKSSLSAEMKNNESRNNKLGPRETSNGGRN